MISYNSEIKELVGCYSSDENKIPLTDHPLFDYLGGHPLSIIILSSLRKNMTLLEIFELLQMIKRNYTKKTIDQSTLVLTLSVEANLTFAKKENPIFYDALIMFALSPSGFLQRHLVELYGELWADCEALLVSRNLIIFKMVDIGEPTKCGLYTMDESLSKIIKSRTSHDEIEASYINIITKMIEILLFLLRNILNNREDILLLYDGNIWKIIERCSAEFDKESFKEDQESCISDNVSEESIHSNRYNFSSKEINGNLLAVSKMQIFAKLGTYVDRK